MASQPPMPMVEIKTSTHNTTRVNMPQPKPLLISRCGFLVSSATFATPSIPRKNQMAKGIAAKTPL